MKLKWIQSVLTERKMGKEQWLIILLAGVLILVVVWPAGEKKEESDTSVPYEEDHENYDESYVKGIEDKLESILSGIDGAGHVSVMITLRSTSEKVVEKDVDRENESVAEEDSEGGSRTTRIEKYSEECRMYVENEGEKPYIRKEIYPEIEGVVVLAEGGGDPVVKKNITEAVMALFNIESHKIRIMKGRWDT